MLPKVPVGGAPKGRGKGPKSTLQGRTQTSKSALSSPREIDWSVFGLDLDAPATGTPRTGKAAPGGTPASPGGQKLPTVQSSPRGGLPHVRLRGVTTAGVPADASATDATDPDQAGLSHLKSSTTRAPGYIHSLPSLMNLLAARGIDFSKPNPDRDVQLPLEYFEDSTMSMRTPEEWHSLIHDQASPERPPQPLKCIALHFMADGNGRWEKGIVLGWDFSARRYRVQWNTGGGDLILGLLVYFEGDDPVLFADRLAAALRTRRHAHSLMKFQHFVDSMPEDKRRRIGKESANRIATMAKAGAWDTSDEFADELNQSLSELVEEAQREYMRVQNLITFDKVLNSGGLKSMQIELELPPPPLAPEVPYSAVKALAQHGHRDPNVPLDFREAFQWFCQASLHIRAEVCLALQVTKGMCIDLMNEQIFDLSFHKPMRLQEFTERQDAAVKRSRGRLNMWVNTIRMRITHCLQQAAVKWYDLNDTSMESYKSSRLRSLLVCSKLMMSDALYELADVALRGFVQAIEELVPRRLDIPADSKALVQVGNVMADSRYECGERVLESGFKTTMFRLDAMVGKSESSKVTIVERTTSKQSQAAIGRNVSKRLGSKRSGSKRTESKRRESQEWPSLFVLGTKISDCKVATLSAFSRGMQIFHDVHSVESVLLPHLIREDKLKPNFAQTDQRIEDLRSRLEVAFDAHEPWLRAILKAMEAYKDVVDLDPDAAVKRLRAESTPIAPTAVKHMIEEHQKRRRELLAEVPDDREAVPVGIYCVDTSSVRSQLCDKLDLAEALLLQYLSERLDTDIAAATAQFSDVFARFREEITTIEEASDMTAYIKSIPGELAKMQGQVNDAMQLTDLLESLRCVLPLTTLDARWKMYASPGDVVKEMQRVEREIEVKTKEFIGRQEMEQKEFERRLKDLEAKIDSFVTYRDIAQVMDVAEEVRKTNAEIKQCEELVRLFNSREVLFDKDQTDYSQLATMVKRFEPYANLWKTAGDWVTNKELWFRGKFDEIDARYCENEVTNGSRLLFKTVRTLKEDHDLLPIVSIAEQIKAELDEFKPNLPLITALRTDGMRDRHWEMITEKCGTSVGPDMAEGFTLESLLQVGVLGHLHEVQDVGDSAGKEYQLEKTLAKMKADWDPLNFDVTEKYRRTGTYILKGDGEAMVLLDEHIVTTQAMMFSSFKGPFEDEINEWNLRLLRVSETLEEWLKCQKSWMYLQPIFDSDDISRQLPTESKRFRSVDAVWRREMENARENPKIIDICATEGLLEKWREQNLYLDMVQKGLEDYLETKRTAFARFYFLSNDELLEILSQTKDPTRVQPFLSKVFEAMAKVTFASDGEINDMISPEGEVVSFPYGVVTYQRNVEAWMCDLEEQMRQAIRAALATAIVAYTEVERTVWVLEHPAQAVLNGSQVHWTLEVEEAFINGQIPEYADRLSEQINGLVMLFRTNLTKIQRTLIGALVVIDVHAKDIIHSFAQEGICDKSAFEWISQLRYYWEVDDRGDENLWVRCVQTAFPYGYEYLGNSMRLVITPLTDLCYITLMGAQALSLGGAPAGPAGTGKTETTKDLAKALAKQCVVFNCSPEMDYIMVGKFFKGLAFSGAWCCFDEFNRINIEVLSVIAQQLLVLFGKKAEMKSYNDKADLEFEGTMITMKPTFNVFITMNPGYAGRAELPDNLAALFRPVAMMVPDYALIGQIMFYAYGFTDAQSLAKKMVTTFTLSSEQLSSQFHYDYGMRAVKSTIEMCGKLKRELGDSYEEDQITLRALRDVNVPKFLKDDLPLFENIITDLFPTTERGEVEYGNLMPVLESEGKKHNVQLTENFVTKVVQLIDTIGVRHGLMLVGPTGGGKTSNWRLLQATSSTLHVEGDAKYQKVQTHVLNPKSITQAQLYGAFDEVTREWSDGVASECVRTAVASGKTGCPDSHWVIFDGPVDALWIESMNTVLDDNKKLCLTSGEIIALTPQMRMVFEVEDLSVASPATVSRCGMVYMEPSALGNEPLVESWIARLPETFKSDVREKLRQLMLTVTLPMITTVRKRTKELSATVDNNLCCAHFRLLDCYFQEFVATETKQISADDITRMTNNVTPLFFFTLVWSVGATCDNRGRKIFSTTLWQQVFELAIEVGGAPALDTGEFWYDYIFQMPTEGPGTGKWVKWVDFAPQYTVPPRAEYQDIVVPTVDSVRLTHTVATYLLTMRHVIVAGNTGTGKSAYVSLWLQKEAPENYLPIFINFSAQTHVNQLQDLLDSKFEKRRRGVYGPPAGKKNVIFVDDLNMPKKEYYGAQPPIELLRQWHDYHGWYNRKELKMQEIIDIAHVSAMGPPGGGRTEISGRLKRHYSTVVAADLARDSITNIFSTILGHFLSQGFEPSIQALKLKIVDCSIKIFEKAGEELLPTPAKSHYTFNLRDIWKVFQGICSLKAKKVSDTMTMIRCYCHENIRVFGDRLTNQQDRDWLSGALEVTLLDTFEVSHANVFDKERLIFADFLGGPDSKAYLEVTDMQALKRSVETALDDYNNEFPVTMPLVMFTDACEHVARICRILRQPSGNALLLGVGGSGRQSLSRLSSYISEYECYQIEVVKGYGMSEFKDDLKGCLMKCGNELKTHTFLFADTQIINDQMVEMINNVLNTGDVPNLYKAEDTDAITMACRGACQQAGLQPTKANIFSVYLTRVKAYLHCVLAFSPVGDAFRTRLRMFPSLVNCCTIDWFAEWPAEALYSVGKQQMTVEDLQLANLEGVLKLFSIVHQSIETSAKDVGERAKRAIYITPTSFLELISTFKKVLDMRRSVVGTHKGRLQKGLDALEAASYAVANMQKDIEAKQPVLEQTKKDVAEMMVVITDDKAKAAVTREECQKVEAEAKAQADSASAIKEDAQRDLDEALPALEVANKALKALKLSSIQEIRVLGNPPAGVRLTMEAVCVMFGIKPVKKTVDMKKVDDYWEASQKGPLNDPKKLLDDLFEFDKDNIPEATIQKIQPYIDREDFDPAAIKKASVACEALCMWCRAMHKYHFVALAVEPKRKLLAEAEASLDVTMTKLRGAQAELKTVEDKIQQLESDYNSSVTKQENLTREMEICSLKLANATKLLDGLGGEKDRWQVEVGNLSEKYNLLPGDSLIAAGMVAYAGPFTEEYRLQFTEDWLQASDEHGVTRSTPCNLLTVLGQPVTIQQWSVNGLPHDNLSVENGIIIATARRWPLMIDPQRQANKYIKQYGKAVSDAGMATVKLSDHNLLQSVELGVQFGKWILLENIGEKLDPALEPILAQQKVRDGNSWIIKLGDKVVSYDQRFRFFMTTTLSNPHYSPETSVKVTLLNFAITPEGLQDQMLGIVVEKEQPEMEEKKQELLKSNAEMTKQLKDVEDDILRLLSAEGDILESKELIDTLEHSKKTSAVINKAMEEAKVTEAEIDAVRKSYRDYAFRASLLFFCVSDLQVIDPMYQFSLQWFQSLARLGIDNSPSGDTQEARLSNLIDYFTYSIYQSVCRGLFEKHKLLFSFSLALKIISGDDRLNQDEVRFLLAGPTGEVKDPRENPAPQWLSAKAWNEVQSLATLEAFVGFPEYFKEAVGEFQRLYDHPETDTLPIPGEWDTKLDSMQKMCFLRTLRPDRLSTAVMNFVKGELGQRFVEPPTFDIAVSYEDSTKVSPLIFVLSPGSDPVADMLAFAESQGMGSKLESISLGQGQGPKAKRLIEEAREVGKWVLLCNCHLSVSWLPELEQICEQMNPDDTDNNFRLWLTSMPSKEFPSLLLQNGVKMTNEPPKGLRANVLSSMMKCDDKVLNDCTKPEIFSRLNFGFCFFHAVCQDRRKFGPIGWNIPYNFTPEDLVTNRRQLKYFLDNYDEVPFKVLQFLGAKINYGGRVTDAIDKRLIECIIKIFVCEDVVQKGPEYKFSNGGLFYCPAASTQEEFLEYLRGLPLTTPPEVFGLHENCEITCAEREALQLLQDSMALTSGSGGGAGGGKSTEVVMYEMAAELIEQTPDLLDLDAIETNFPTKYEESRNTVLKQEAAKYNKLLQILKAQLPLFRRAINGLVAMTEDLEALGRGLFLNAVPTTWAETSFLSLKPLTAWYKDLNARVQFMRRWQADGHPISFWISGLYFPQAFFTAILQNFARREQHAIDRINFDVQVRDDCYADGRDLSEHPPAGCYMWGLYLEGCRWDDKTHVLAPSHPKELFAMFPVVLFKPELDWKPKEGRYACPIYKVLSRKGTLSTTGHSTNFVRHMEVPSNEEPDVWIRAGVAAFLALRY